MRLCSATTSNRLEDLVPLLEAARTKIWANSGYGFAGAAIALVGWISNFAAYLLCACALFDIETPLKQFVSLRQNLMQHARAIHEIVTRSPLDKV